MKTIKLTEVEIDLLVNSLEIAATVYYEQFEQISKRFKEYDGKEYKLYWYDKSCQIRDLAEQIKNASVPVFEMPILPIDYTEEDLKIAALKILNNSNKLQAVKFIKERTGWSLLESKEFCEDVQLNNPQ